MTDPTPAEGRKPNPVPDFTPVPRRNKRADGWTPKRQRDFIAALSRTGSVSHAAASVGMATTGAYALRRAPGAESFDKAWDAALDDGVRRLAAIAYSRATEGVATPLMHGGKQVGEKRAYSDRLLMFLLRHHDPEKYGANPGLHPGTTSASRRQQEETGQSLEQEQAEGTAALDRIATKLRACRDSYVRSIAHDRKKRAAWDRLCPRVNWKYAAESMPRILPDGTQQSLFIPKVDQSFPWMRDPQFVIPIANGFEPDFSEIGVEGDISDDPAVDPVRRIVEALKARIPAGDAPEFDMDEAVAGLRTSIGLGPWVPGETVAQVMRRIRANRSNDPDAEARADPASLRSFSAKDFTDYDRAESDRRVEALNPFPDGNLDKAGIDVVPLPEVGRDTIAEGEVVPNENDEELRQEKLRLARKWFNGEM